MDYDRIADRYDLDRHRDKEADPDLLAYLAEHPDLDDAALRVLDVGCGTGNQLVADLERVPRGQLVGLDLFHGMLSRAVGKSRRIAWVQGDGAHLPFAGASFNLATSQFSFHHVRAKSAMVGEVYRVLRSGGRFVMTNITPREMPSWAIYRYFPAAWGQDLADFAAPRECEALVRGAGFDRVTLSLQRQQFCEDLGVLLATVRMRVVSQLVRLTEEDYGAGLRRIEGDLARGGGVGSVPSESCIVKIVGDKE